MRNLIKYTLGLPLLIIMSLAPIISWIFGYLIGEDDGQFNIIDEIIDFWKPIRKKK